MRYIKLIIVSFCMGLFLFGTNSYAGKPVEWQRLANNTSDLVIIKGEIRSIDLFKMEIILDGCSLLGDKPLKLSRETSYYLEPEDENINSVRGGARFTEDDRIDYYELEVGHTIECNYEIRNGEFWAVTVVRTFPHVQHILF